MGTKFAGTVKAWLRGREYEVSEHGADAWGWINTRNWESATFDAMDKLLTPGSTFVDVGAWIGTMVLHASGRASRVIAVEPDPVAYTVLAKNVKMNNIQAELHNVAIMGHEGTIAMGSALLGASTTRINPEAGHGIGRWEDDQVITAKCMTIGKLCHDVHGPMVIKVDAEGAEEQILTDPWIQEHKPAIIVEMHPYWWKNKDFSINELAKMYKHVEWPCRNEHLVVMHD